MKRKNGGENMQKNTANLGIKLKVVSYVGENRFEREKTIFSIKQLYKILSVVKSNGIIYGLGVENDSLVLHLFIDRAGHMASNEKENKGVIVC